MQMFHLRTNADHNFCTVGVVFAPTLNLPGPLISLFVEEKARIFGQPYDEATSPIANQSSPTSSHATPTDLRSPRKQMFSDLPTPAYNQTSFQPMHFGGNPSRGQPYTNASSSYDNNNNNNNHGMAPMQPQTYAPYQMAPHGEGGFGSLNDALRAPNAYNPAPSSSPQNGGDYSSDYSNNGGGANNQLLMTPRDVKAKRRESGMLAAGQMMSPGKKPSLSRLREEESGTSF
jgi:RalA-binding protein 1